MCEILLLETGLVHIIAIPLIIKHVRSWNVNSYFDFFSTWSSVFSECKFKHLTCDFFLVGEVK